MKNNMKEMNKTELNDNDLEKVNGGWPWRLADIPTPPDDPEKPDLRGLTTSVMK